MNLTLKYPPYQVRLKKEGGKQLIFDFVRKKWLVLTPEEWVRQHVLNYLIQVRKYPLSAIAVEKELQLNDLRKRFDAVVFDRHLQPYLIIECKAPYIALDKMVLEQALRYNLIIRAPFLMISNGVDDLVIDAKGSKVSLPDYKME